MTETRWRSQQIEWLEKNRVPYSLGRKGGINVLRAYIEKMHGMKEQKQPKEYEPNLDAFPKRRAA